MRRDTYDTRGHYDLDAWTTQMRRAAVSIPSNIAEGAARTGAREFAQFLNIARASLSELETQLLIASDLAYMNADDPVFALTDRLSRLLSGLHKAVVGQQPTRMTHDP